MIMLYRGGGTQLECGRFTSKITHLSLTMENLNIFVIF